MIYIYIYPWWPFIIHDQKRRLWIFLRKKWSPFFSVEQNRGPKNLRHYESCHVETSPMVGLQGTKKSPCRRAAKKEPPVAPLPLLVLEWCPRRWGWFLWVLLVGSKTPSQKLRSFKCDSLKKLWKWAIFYDDFKLLQKNLCGPFHFEDVFETCLSLGDRKPRTTALWLRRWHPEDSSSPRWAPKILTMRDPNISRDLWLIYGWFMVDFWLIYGWFMVDLWLTYGWFMDIYGWFMVDLWLIYGWFMVDLWLIYGWFLIDIWLMYGWYGWFMVDLWLMYGWFMVDLWLMYGWCMVDMVDLWLIYGWFMVDVWLMYGWCMVDMVDLC